MFRDSVLAGPVLRRGGVTALAVAAAATMFVGTAATAEPAAVVGEVSADSIAAARAQAIGTTVTVVGTATTPSGVFESSFYDKGFGLQSGNSGIYISDPNNSGVVLGDRVQVTGVLADQEGLLVVRPTTVEVIGTTTQISPARLPPLNAIGEGSEGRLVTVSGIVSGPVVDDLPYGHKILVSGARETPSSSSTHRRESTSMPSPSDARSPSPVSVASTPAPTRFFPPARKPMCSRVSRAA